MTTDELTPELPEELFLNLENESFKLKGFEITPEEVLDQIKLLNTKKTYGWDKLSPVFIKVESMNLVSSIV